MKKFFTALVQSGNLLWLVAALFAIITAVWLGFDVAQRFGYLPDAAVGYTEAERFVPEKVSVSAAIKLLIPAGLDVARAQSQVSFEPPLEGVWLKTAAFSSLVKTAQANSDARQALFFKPAATLAVNTRYQVKLAMADEAVLRGEFLAVEDPKVMAILPALNTESPEQTDISIVFSRPMVPLSTLTELEVQAMPVEISPQTKGRFKWINTSTLQFQPSAGLKASARYKVKVNAGFISIEGLKVTPFESAFYTRPLRYEDVLVGEALAYNAPIKVYFNQPVDLEKTRREISVVNTTKGQPVDLMVEYSRPPENKRLGLISRLFGLAYAPPARMSDNNEATLEIYQKADHFGRPKFWDFSQHYTFNITKAFPKSGGDILLNERRSFGYSVGDAIAGLSAESTATSLVAPDVFDPKGKLWVDFYEPVDLSRLQLDAPGVTGRAYGEKCRDESLGYSSPDDCEKVPDESRVSLTFEPSRVALGEALNLVFKAIYNKSGLKINAEPLRRALTAYGPLNVVKTLPVNQARDATLTNLRLCTTTPLAAPAQADYATIIKANYDLELLHWPTSFRAANENTQAEPDACPEGSFQTEASYGLMPNKNYKLNLDLVDVFGQKLTLPLDFGTGAMPDDKVSLSSLQAEYSVTTPQKATLNFVARNLSSVDFKICKLSASTYLATYLAARHEYESHYSSVDCPDGVVKKLTLPEKFWVNNFFEINLADYFENPLGHYVLSVSHPTLTEAYYPGSGQKPYQRPIFRRAYVTVSNLAVAEKRIDPQTAYFGGSRPLTKQTLAKLNNLYWVNDVAALGPVSGAKVNFLKGQDLTPAGTFLTDEHGLAATPVIADIAAVSVVKGNDSALILNDESSLAYANLAGSARKIFLYTDKPIYRPGQDVFVKGIYRIGYDGSYELADGEYTNITVRDPRYQEIYSSGASIDREFGTFETKINLPPQAALGSYAICVGEANCTYVDVEEYIGAAFEVTAKADKEEYISKDTARLDLNANYYFGVALSEGTVDYSVSVQNYYLGYDNLYEAGGFGDRFLYRGQTSLNSQGQARFEIPLDFAKLFKDEADRTSKIMVIDATVKNSNGQAVATQISFIVYAGQFSFDLSGDYYGGKNQPLNYAIKSTDLKGKALAGQAGKLAVYKTEWQYVKRLEADGGYSYKWDKKRTLVEQADFQTDGAGGYQRTLKFADVGEYELEAVGQDGRDNTVRDTTTVYIYGDSSVTQPTTNDTTLELVTENQNLKPGEQGSVVIKSPFKHARALITLERGRLFKYDILEVNGGLARYEFDVLESYTPNVYLSVVLFGGAGEVKFGQLMFSINTDRHELKITVKPNKTSYLPGEKVALDIRTTDATGRPVKAEVSLAVVDKSVLALKGNPKEDPAGFFYGGFPLTVSTASNLKSLLLKFEPPALDGKGGGGSPDELKSRARGVFRETAFWQAQVATADNGTAHVEFTLPDNLTTWQTETIGVTADTKLGTNYADFTSRKDLMIVGLRPRFIMAGDEFMLGARIFNQTPSDRTVEVSVSSKTLALVAPAKQAVPIGPNETMLVYFSATAPANYEKGRHEFQILATSAELKDALIDSIPIHENNTYETTATANASTADATREYIFVPNNVIPDKGGLTVKSSATLASFVTEGLKYLIGYPYGGSEQVASQLDAIALVKKGLGVSGYDVKYLEPIKVGDNNYSVAQLVERGLASLAQKRNWDGGYGLWAGSPSELFTTLHVLTALVNLRAAGYALGASVIDQAADYVLKQFNSNEYQDPTLDSMIAAAYALNLANKNDSGLTTRIAELARRPQVLNEKLSSSALAYLALYADKLPSSLRPLVNQALDNRLKVDGRGAFIESSPNVFWSYFETPIKNTALYLKVLSARTQTSAMRDSVLRWLLGSRAKDGSWGTTPDTLLAIEALTDYLAATNELNADFKLTHFLNDRKLQSYQFNKASIFGELTSTVAMSELKPNINNVLTLKKDNQSQQVNKYYYDAAFKYYLPAASLPPRDEGFGVTRAYYSENDLAEKSPRTSGKVGEVFKVKLNITVPKSRQKVSIEDFIPAGFEIINQNLATSGKNLDGNQDDRTNWGSKTPGAPYQIYPDYQESRDDRVYAFVSYLAPGIYEYEYFARALIPGTFTHLPAQVYETYLPENFGRTAGAIFKITR